MVKPAQLAVAVTVTLPVMTTRVAPAFADERDRLVDAQVADVAAGAHDDARARLGGGERVAHAWRGRRPWLRRSGARALLYHGDGRRRRRRASVSAAAAKSAAMVTQAPAASGAADAAPTSTRWRPAASAHAAQRVVDAQALGRLAVDGDLPAGVPRLGDDEHAAAAPRGTSNAIVVGPSRISSAGCVGAQRMLGARRRRHARRRCSTTTERPGCHVGAATARAAAASSATRSAP